MALWGLQVWEQQGIAAGVVVLNLLLRDCRKLVNKAIAHRKVYRHLLLLDKSETRMWLALRGRESLLHSSLPQHEMFGTHSGPTLSFPAYR